MRVLMMTDLEGVSGVVSFEDQAYPTGKYYEKAKELLTGEVNAAVDGLLSEGVEDVVVMDGHGAGGMIFEMLHPKAKLLHGRPFFCGEKRNIWQKSFDATVMIGQHAMAGVETGNLNHTQNSKAIEYYKLNGKYIGEIAQWALYCGALELPMIFLAGDQAACDEATDLIPQITTADVKQGTSRTSAICLSKESARELICDKIAQAVKNHRSNPIEPLVWPGPYTLEKRFFHSQIPDMFTANPMVKRIDNLSVKIESDNILDIIYA